MSLDIHMLRRIAEEHVTSQTAPTVLQVTKSTVGDVGHWGKYLGLSAAGSLRRAVTLPAVSVRNAALATIRKVLHRPSATPFSELVENLPLRSSSDVAAVKRLDGEAEVAAIFEERQRGAAIMVHGIQLGNPSLAASLINSRISACEAIRVLNTAKNLRSPTGTNPLGRSSSN